MHRINCVLLFLVWARSDRNGLAKKSVICVNRVLVCRRAENAARSPHQIRAAKLFSFQADAITRSLHVQDVIRKRADINGAMEYGRRRLERELRPAVTRRLFPICST